jgi:hypothetical protein
MSLSDEQKEALRHTRLARGHVPNGNKGKTVNNGAKSNKVVIAVLTARLDALVAAKDNEGQRTTESTDKCSNDDLRQRPRGPGE